MESDKQQFKIKDYVIPKPWGNEFLFFENVDIGIWLLNIDHNKKTSLHCHPNKKTGLIVLSGEIEFNFLNSKHIIKEYEKITIWPGVFHSSKSINQNGSVILEVESPKNKYDLIRIEDDYNRQTKNYEASDTWIPRTKSNIWLKNQIKNSPLTYKNYTFTLEYINYDNISDFDDSVIIILLDENGIKSNKTPVTRVGDVLTIKTLKYLSKKFILYNTKIIAIRK